MRFAIAGSQRPLVIKNHRRIIRAPVIVLRRFEHTADHPETIFSRGLAKPTHKGTMQRLRAYTGYFRRKLSRRHPGHVDLWKDDHMCATSSSPLDLDLCTRKIFFRLYARLHLCSSDKHVPPPLYT